MISLWRSASAAALPPDPYEVLGVCICLLVCVTWYSGGAVYHLVA